jgi:hypothetical protein
MPRVNLRPKSSRKLAHELTFGGGYRAAQVAGRASAPEEGPTASSRVEV